MARRSAPVPDQSWRRSKDDNAAPPRRPLVGCTPGGSVVVGRALSARPGTRSVRTPAGALRRSRPQPIVRQRITFQMEQILEGAVELQLFAAGCILDRRTSCYPQRPELSRSTRCRHSSRTDHHRIRRLSWDHYDNDSFRMDYYWNMVASTTHKGDGRRSNSHATKETLGFLELDYSCCFTLVSKTFC